MRKKHSKTRASSSQKAALQEAGDLTPRRDAVLLAALPDVPFDGWTDALLDRALARTGGSAAEKEHLFPRGVPSLLAHFADWADRQMEARLLTMDLSGLRVRDRIAAGVSARLDVLAPYRQAAQAALGRRVSPRQLWSTADRIWWIAGDTATDWNHYSKRLLLSAVIAATTLYWFSDESEGQADTRAFLERRIAGVLALGRGIGQATDSASRLRARLTPRRRKKEEHT